MNLDDLKYTKILLSLELKSIFESDQFAKSMRLDGMDWKRNDEETLETFDRVLLNTTISLLSDLIEPIEKPLVFEEGVSYNTRNGIRMDVIHIIRDKNVTYPIIALRNGIDPTSYTLKGKHDATNPEIQELDLVSIHVWEDLPF